MDLKKTPFTDIHIELGAKMAEFAGYNMPIQYEGINPEHINVINNVGVFDVSHMGAVIISGPKAVEFIQTISSNDVTKLEVGKAQYTYMPNDNGGIVDDFIMYMLEGGRYMCAVNAANIEKDFNWMKKHQFEGVTLENDSDRVSILAVQGPKAKATIQKCVDINLDDIPYYHYAIGKFAGLECIISNTGYTGAGGFELYFKDLKDPHAVWDKLFEAGEEFNIKPTGLGARDTLRLEMGFCLYGNDIDDTTNPLEAGLGWVTKFVDGKEKMPSRDILLKTKEEGIQKRLVGFELKEKGVPRHGYDIVNEKGDIIGHVTSGTQSPVLGKGIGLGYVSKEYKEPGTEVFIRIRKKDLPAEVIKLPFRK